jgi:hypothetical protein
MMTAYIPFYVGLQAYDTQIFACLSLSSWNQWIDFYET